MIKNIDESYFFLLRSGQLCLGDRSKSNNMQSPKALYGYDYISDFDICLTHNSTDWSSWNTLNLTLLYMDGTIECKDITYDEKENSYGVFIDTKKHVTDTFKLEIVKPKLLEQFPYIENFILSTKTQNRGISLSIPDTFEFRLSRDFHIRDIKTFLQEKFDI